MVPMTDFHFSAIRFFESATEQAAVRIIEEEAQLPQETFDRLCYGLSDVLHGRTIGSTCPFSDESVEVSFSAKFSTENLQGLTSPEIDELRDSFQTYAQHSPSVNRRERTNSVDGISQIKFRFDTY